MTREELDAIRQRLAKAQPPIWHKLHSLSIEHEWMPDEDGGRTWTGYCQDNVDFIIAAHNHDIPRLLAFVDEQAKTIATLEQVIHDIDIGGEANYGAERERRAILVEIDGVVNDLRDLADSLGETAGISKIATRNRTIISEIRDRIASRGPVPQDAPPPAKLRDRVEQLETALRAVYSQVRHHSSGYARNVLSIANKALEDSQ